MLAHPDLIFVSLEDWDDVWRRNQFICAKLVQRNPGLRILFVQPALDVSNAIRTRRWRRLFQRMTREVGAGGRIVCMRGLKLLPNSFAWARALNERLLRGNVRRLATKLGITNAVLWINDHAAVHMAGAMGESAVVYDITDDWTAYKVGSAATQRAVHQDGELCRKADVVLVCSERLRQLKTPVTRRVELVANGVDTEHYAQVDNPALPIPADARDWKHPVLGYTGTVHPERVDVPLVEAIAQRLPHATLAFVGPLMLPSADVERLRRCPNIRLLGARPYLELPAYMRAFDICMVPHVVTPFTESLNPIKLWEYLAAGKPIIATPVAGFREFSNVVHLVNTAADVERAVAVCLNESSELAKARRSISRKHSWDERLGRIEQILRVPHSPAAETVGAA